MSSRDMSGLVALMASEVTAKKVAVQPGSGDSLAEDTDRKYGSKWWRGSVLAIFCLSNFLESINGVLYPPIISDLTVLWGVSKNQINIITTVGLIVPFIFYFFAMRFADTHPLEQSYYFGMTCNFIGSILRYLLPYQGNTGYWVALSTQILISLTHPWVAVLPPKISATYFPLKERGLATSLGVLFGLLGTGGGMAISPFFGNNLKGLYALHSIASLAPLVISVFFFDVRQCFPCCCKKRKEPLSDSEGSTNDSECENAQETFLQTLKRMLFHRGFMQSMLGATLAVATVNTWINTVDMNAGPSFDSPGSISLIAILFFGFGVLGAIGAGVMLDKLRDPVRLLRWIVAFAYPMPFMCMLGWFFDSGITVFVGMAMTALFGFGLFGLTIELGIEYTFKQGVDNEATVAGVMNILVNAQTAILIFLSTPENVFPTSQYIPIFWLCLFTLCVLILAYPLPKTYKRMEHYKSKECADKSEPEDSPQVADSQVLSQV